VKLSVKRKLEQCSRTGSKETQDGYLRELRHFTRWRDVNHPHLHLRELDPVLVGNWVAGVRAQVEAGELKPRSFNRRLPAVSALYRWASEPTRSAVTGVPRKLVPRRSTMHAPTLTKPLGEDQLGAVLAAIARAAAGHRAIGFRRPGSPARKGRAASPVPSGSVQARWRSLSPWAGVSRRTGCSPQVGETAP